MQNRREKFYLTARRNKIAKIDLRGKVLNPDVSLETALRTLETCERRGKFVDLRREFHIPTFASRYVDS